MSNSESIEVDDFFLVTRQMAGDRPNAGTVIGGDGGDGLMPRLLARLPALRAAIGREEDEDSPSDTGRGLTYTGGSGRGHDGGGEIGAGENELYDG